ncbi:MAG: hypothetical protein ABL985_02490 [Casimicrobium sp.]
MNPFHTVRAALALSATLTLAPVTLAADALTDAMQAAYAPYRAALFRTNNKAQAESEQAMSQARQAWADISARYAMKPPAPYDRDPTVAATLADVAAVYDAATKQIAATQLVPAHETLEKARDLMSELRRRNGVVTFSDHMNAYHEQMEHVLIDGPAQLASAQGGQKLLASVGALDYLAARLRTQAPAALTANPEFVALQQQVQNSVAGLRDALVKQDLAAAKSALDKVKKPYSQMFLKFG